MKKLLEKFVRIDIPTFGRSGRILPPVAIYGSASYGPSVDAQSIVDKHKPSPNIARREDAEAATRTAVNLGFRTFITGGAGFKYSMMHHQGFPAITDQTISIAISTPHIVNFEGVLPNTDCVAIVNQGGFPVRKYGFLSLTGADWNNAPGPGTLDELAQTLESMVYGEVSKHRPVGLNNKDGFYDPVLKQLHLQTEHGYIQPQVFERLIIQQSGVDCVYAIKDRLLDLTDERFARVTNNRIHFKGMETGGYVQFEGKFNASRGRWKKGGFGAPVIAMVTGRAVTDDAEKMAKRHALTDDIDVERILTQIKVVQPNAIIMFVNEASRLARRIHDEARKLNLDTIGVQATQQIGNAMFDTGKTRVVDNSHLIDHYILEHADVVMPMDLSMRSMSIFWQALVYANIRDPNFALREIVLFGKNDIHAHTMAMIQRMAKNGTINPRIFDDFYYIGQESEIGDIVSSIFKCEGKRSQKEPFGDPPPEKIAHVAIPPKDTVIDFNPNTAASLHRLLRHLDPNVSVRREAAARSALALAR